MTDSTLPNREPSDSAEAALPGYVFEERLGRGGMGVVYRARQLTLDRVVAVKMILDGAHADEEDRARFLREAKTLAQLQHPHIVQVHEVGEYQGRPYLAMEYVAGGNLEERLREQPLPPAEAAALVRTLAQAVQAAHEAGIVHRDLKPANILLAAGGVAEKRATPPAAKISDFGLAKRLDDDSGQTRTGAIVGTPSYMAPEQAAGQGKHVGPLADVYALGAILYECLTGRPPFRAAHVAETLVQVVQQEPVPPRQFNPIVPRDLETLCLKCLEKAPERRFQSAAELAEELERFLAGRPVQARPVGRVERGWRWCRRNPAVASLTALLALLLLAATIASTIGALTMRRLAEQERNASRQLVGQLSRQYVANGERALDEEDYARALLWFARALELDQDNPTRVQAHQLRLAATWQQLPRLVGFFPHDQGVSAAQVSPDGRLVATASFDRTARLWDVATGKLLHEFRHEGFVYCVRFSPDGQRLATAGADAVVSVWDVRTGQRMVGPLLHAEGVYDVRFSPDGRKLVTGCADPFSAWAPPANIDPFRPIPRDPSKPTVAIWDLATSTCLHLPGPSSRTFRVAVSNDGRRVAVASDANVGMARVYDLATGQPVGAPLGAPIPRGSAEIVADLDISPDGNYLAVGSLTGRWRVWDVRTRQLVAGPFEGRVFFGPDGRHFVGRGLRALPSGKELQTWPERLGCVEATAWAAESCRVLAWSGKQQLRLWDGVTGEPLGLPLLVNEADLWDKTLGERGRLVLVASSADHAARLWDLAGAAPARSLPHAGTLVAVGRSQARWLTASADGLVRLWDADTGAAVGPGVRHGGALRDAALSPDGRVVATAGDDRVARLWDAESQQGLGDALIHRHPVERVLFTPDSTRLLTLERWEINQQWLRLWDVRTRRQLWTSNPLMGLKVMTPVVTPDGRFAATAEADGKVTVFELATGQAVVMDGKHNYWAQTADFSPDSRLLLTVGGDRMARVWDRVEGKQRLAIAHHHMVNCGAFSPDGQRFATGDGSGAARIWAADDGRALTPVLWHSQALTAVQFDADGRRLLTAAKDGTIQVWDATTGERLGPPWKEHGSSLALFAPDGRQILSAGQGQVRLWPNRVESRSVADWQALAQVQSGRRIDATGSLAQLTPTEMLAAWEELRRCCPSEVVCTAAQVKEWERQEVERLLRLGRPRDAEAWLDSRNRDER